MIDDFSQEESNELRKFIKKVEAEEASPLDTYVWPVFHAEILDNGQIAVTEIATNKYPEKTSIFDPNSFATLVPSGSPIYSKIVNNEIDIQQRLTMTVEKCVSPTNNHYLKIKVMEYSKEQIKSLKADIKKIAQEQLPLKNQRKTIHLVGDRILQPSYAASMHGSNRFSLRHYYIAYGFMRGKKLEEIESKGSKTPPREDFIKRIIEKYGQTVCANP